MKTIERKTKKKNAIVKYVFRTINNYTKCVKKKLLNRVLARINMK
jgi:hypothetical protein